MDVAHTFYNHPKFGWFSFDCFLSIFFYILAKLFYTLFAIDNVIHNTKLWYFVINNHIRRPQFCIMNHIMNNIVNDKKVHNIVNDITNDIVDDK